MNQWLRCTIAEAPLGGGGGPWWFLAKLFSEGSWGCEKNQGRMAVPDVVFYLYYIFNTK
jgi:hypothetical protein